MGRRMGSRLIQSAHRLRLAKASPDISASSLHELMGKHRGAFGVLRSRKTCPRRRCGDCSRGAYRLICVAARRGWITPVDGRGTRHARVFVVRPLDVMPRDVVFG